MRTELCSDGLSCDWNHSDVHCASPPPLRLSLIQFAIYIYIFLIHAVWRTLHRLFVISDSTAIAIPWLLLGLLGQRGQSAGLPHRWVLCLKYFSAATGSLGQWRTEALTEQKLCSSVYQLCTALGPLFLSRVLCTNCNWGGVFMCVCVCVVGLCSEFLVCTL